jgi:PAS domain-containing protein
MCKPSPPSARFADALRLRQAEEAAREWHAAFDAVGDALGLLDHQGRLLRCNRALARLLGRPAEEVLGQPAGPLLGPEAAALLARGEPVPDTEVCLGPRWYRLSANRVPGPLPGRAHGPGALLLRLSDVTARKEAEGRLFQALKLEMVGRRSRRAGGPRR